MALLRFCYRKTTKNLNFWSFFYLFGRYFEWNTCTDFQKICSWTSYKDPKLIKNVSNFSVTLLRFCCRKSTEKSKFSEFFLSLTDPLVVTFNEILAPTSRKYVAEQAIEMPNWWKISQPFWGHSSVFVIEKQPKILNF